MEPEHNTQEPILQGHTGYVYSITIKCDSAYSASVQEI